MGKYLEGLSEQEFSQTPRQQSCSVFCAQLRSCLIGCDRRWSALLTSTLSEELAYAGGLDPKREQLILTLSLAITVAVAIKVVGILLIAALLIIPAAAARGLSRTPEAMALIAAAIGVVSAVGGLQGAYYFDTPAGPSIVCVAAILFALLNVFGWRRNLG